MKLIWTILTLLSFHIILTAQTDFIPMQAENWDYNDTAAAFIIHEGSPALSITGPGEVILKERVFSEGTIEFDYYPTELGFCGISFRRNSPADDPSFREYSEYVYLRNFDPEGKMIQGGIQYAPFLRGQIYGTCFLNTKPRSG